MCFRVCVYVHYPHNQRRSAEMATTAAREPVTRHRLRLGQATFRVLKAAAERALNVPAARAARTHFGRAAAAATLTGRRIRALDVETDACKVVVERSVDLSPPPSTTHGLVRKKRRSGRSNWPKNAAERAAWMARRAARDARRAAGLVDLAVIGTGMGTMCIRGAGGTGDPRGVARAQPDADAPFQPCLLYTSPSPRDS